ncbi:MAG: hypothetical protein U9Q82_15480 [Chloroflexota bacterium]|nr:hypothetical protein [Chloroflexota bacterium]
MHAAGEINLRRLAVKLFANPRRWILQNSLEFIRWRGGGGWMWEVTVKIYLLIHVGGFRIPASNLFDGVAGGDGCGE